MIVDAYTKIKATQTPEVQASLTKQEAKPVPQVVVQAPAPAPAKAPEVKKEVAPVAPTQAEIDYAKYNDNSEARMAEITNNLNNMAATNPNTLKDINSFRATYSYNNRSAEQKQVLDNRYNGYKTGQTL